MKKLIGPSYFIKQDQKERLREICAERRVCGNPCKYGLSVFEIAKHRIVENHVAVAGGSCGQHGHDEAAAIGLGDQGE